MTKREIADVLAEIATLLELKGENPFKIRAYINGARKLETLEESLDDLISSGTLGEVPGFGKALVEKIETLYGSIFEGILGEKVSTKPVIVQTPFPWVARR